jgi:hypothetical protein
MFGEETELMQKELELLHDALSFEEILEESDLTEEEVVAILYRLGHIKMPPYLTADMEIHSDED